ncbi:DUF3737 family protein [Cloacibacillus sp. An23]|uniref:DUF3737 family protein n=1 Tax=Cloacibacillus sp. An23 TaxID=1965591 RepID=UPI000B36CB77|nr:DUF3737 family protein [Cloacibacillus sp. An23]OUO94292.1 hypothetical protein B5F39_03460 [Cloacibacillus sp. An23]
MTVIENKTFDEERALYGSRDVTVKNCRFDGPADGESALKESSGVRVEGCFCNLRYPFWHDRGLTIRGCELTELCRAAIWYSEDVDISDTKLHGIKALRECGNVTVRGCDIVSPEFGWSVRDVTMENCTAESEYFMMRSRDLRFTGVTFKGKYSFQYIENAVFERCSFDTKDAFWHSRGVVVRDSVIKGEYLGWYSEGLTLVNCKISGTQPLCYCKGLKLINCEMENAGLCFEKSEVEAVVTTPVTSVKNPRSGVIAVPAVGEIIMDDPEARGAVVAGGAVSCAAL